MFLVFSHFISKILDHLKIDSQPPPTPVSEQISLSRWWVLVSTDPLCRDLSALPPAPLLLCSPPWLWCFAPSTPSLHQWRGFLVCGNFSSFTAPSQRCRSHPYSLVSVFPFFFCLTQVCGDFLAFWGVWGLLPVFSRCSVGVVPHVDVFLMYLLEGRSSPCLTPLPSWTSPPFNVFYLSWLFFLTIFQHCYGIYTQNTIFCHISSENI